jgi:hypothetical protein
MACLAAKPPRELNYKAASVMLLQMRQEEAATGVVRPMNQGNTQSGSLNLETLAEWT